MFRKAYLQMKAWENQALKEPLMLIGVRQAGKTWLIKEFCKETYTDYFYVNLEEQQAYQSAFEGDLTPASILRNLGILAGRKLTENTAIIIDEIQVCERAVTALKYFCEAEENYRVIVAGSLLGVKINRFASSFPVGKVQILHIFPMDFEEFLLACGQSLLNDSVHEATSLMRPLPAAIHEKALQLCYDYMITGGMPKAVEDYVKKDCNITFFRREIHQELILAYLADMTKYVSSAFETEKITQVYQSVPRQLAKENPKFKYTVVRENANKRDFNAPLDWLKAAGMIYKINGTEAPMPPLKGYEKEDMFKIYLSDTGILSALSGIKPRDLLNSEANIYKGAVVENYVIQQFAARQKEIYYYKPSQSMEIDIIYDDGKHIIPAEIKSGRHKRSVSLDNYRKQFSPEYAVRFSALNFGEKDKLISCPLYAVTAFLSARFTN